MDTYVYLPNLTNAQEMANYLLDTLELLQPFGHHVIRIATDDREVGTYAAYLIDNDGTSEQSIQRALVAVITYCAALTGYPTIALRLVKK